MPDDKSTSPGRKALIVAYHFPPAGGLAAAGSQRILKLAKYLPANGWTPVIVTARVDNYEDYVFIDEAMMERVPAGLEVRRTRVLHLLDPFLRVKKRITGLFTGQQSEQARLHRSPGNEYVDPSAASAGGNQSYARASWFQRLKDGFTDLFEIPDEVSGWILPAVLAGRREIRRGGVDAIIATGRPWTSLVAGAVLKTLYKKPFIADFRDPWMTNPFRLRYSRIKNNLDAAVESWVIRRSDVIVANTDELAAEFAERFGDDVAGKCIVARNGFDPDELHLEELSAVGDANPSVFDLVHAGALYGKRDPAVLLEAVARLMDLGAIDAERFRLTLVGPIDLPYDIEGRMSELGVTDVVRTTGIVSHSESLEAIADSSMCVLLQPGTTTQVPSKLYEYVGCGKPILAVVNPESATASLVASRSIGVLAPVNDVIALADAVLQEYLQFFAEGMAIVVQDGIKDEFDVRRSAANIARSMDHLTG